MSGAKGKAMNGTITRAAQWWLDRHARAPRLAGFSQDDGVPDRGVRYGGAGTIHNTGTIDVRVVDGRVTEVWFRCRMLAASVVEGEAFAGGRHYPVDGAPLVAVELAR